MLGGWLKPHKSVDKEGRNGHKIEQAFCRYGDSMAGGGPLSIHINH
jgi:hypothetical protein